MIVVAVVVPAGTTVAVEAEGGAAREVEVADVAMMIAARNVRKWSHPRVSSCG
jgi:hypothetical protein